VAEIVVKKDDSILEIMEECIAEDMEAMREVIREDLVPLIEYRTKLEKDIYNKAYKELRELEKDEV